VVSEPLPDFLIIGAMRAGTTALAHYLSQHPEIFISPVKEIHFFDRNSSRGLAWYRRHFSGAEGGKAIGEATPGYMYAPDAPGRMWAVVPHARLIAVLRDPIDRAYSHYWHNRALGLEPLSFAAAIEAEPRRLAGGGLGQRRYSYLDRGRYLPQLLRVCKHFSRDALFVILFEELRDHPAVTFAAVCRFLGVDETFTPPALGRPVNRFVQFRSGRLERIARRLPPLLRGFVRRFNVVRVPYPPLDPALRETLWRRLAADNQALAAWLGKDLSPWMVSAIDR